MGKWNTFPPCEQTPTACTAARMLHRRIICKGGIEDETIHEPAAADHKQMGQASAAEFYHVSGAGATGKENEE